MVSHDLRITFIGGTKRGYKTLRELIKQGFYINHIYAMIEDEHEKEKYSSKIELLAKNHNISCSLTKKLKQPDIEQVQKSKPDLILVVGWRTLIDKKLYQFPKYGAWAAHDSLLPAYRGFAPLNWAIINSEDHTGVTLFKIDDGVDSGPIIMQKKIPIYVDSTAPLVYEKVINATVELVLKSLEYLKAGTLKFIPQDDRKATYTCPRIPADGYIDWTKSAVEIKSMIQALVPPYPGAYSYYKGEFFKIITCELPAAHPKYVGSIPGRPIKIHYERGVEVLTGKGILFIKDIITEDGGIKTADRLIRSTKVTLGLSIQDIYDIIRKG